MENIIIILKYPSSRLTPSEKEREKGSNNSLPLNCPGSRCSPMHLLLPPIPAQSRQAAHHHPFCESSCTGHSSRDASATSGLDKDTVPHTAYSVYCLALCRKFATSCPRKSPAPYISRRSLHDTGPSPALLLRPLALFGESSVSLLLITV